LARPLLDENELIESGPQITVPLPLDKVDPNPANPRQRYDEIDALAENIRTFGLMQPIIARRNGDRYELLGGHRRRAAYLLLRDAEPWNDTWKAIPAVVVNANDERAYDMLLSAQLHTKNWKPREEAAALERYAAGGLTLKEIGKRLQRTESWASKRLRVYADSVLSGYVQTMHKGEGGEHPLLPASVGEELLTVSDPKERKRLAEKAIDEAWSPATARAEVRKLNRDLNVRDIARRAKELLDILGAVDANKIPIETARELWTLHGRIEILGRGAAEPTTRTRKPHFPKLEEAIEASPAARRQSRIKPGQRRKPGITFRKQA
jgi:ParB family chromosome partitioning protein